MATWIGPKARRTGYIAVFVAAGFGWLGYRLDDAFEQLRHAGDGPASEETFFLWGAVITAVLYLVSGLLLAAGARGARSLTMILVVPAVVCAGYAFQLGSGNYFRNGFPVATLCLISLTLLGCSVLLATRAVNRFR